MWKSNFEASLKITMARFNVKNLRKRTELSQEELARILETSWVTVSRWERKIAAPNPEAETRLRRLSELLRRIGRVLPAQEILRFLETPHPLLRNCPPMDLLKSDYAFQQLVDFVEGAKSGDMA